MDSRITMKYKKKVRLLVTNKCSRNCKYCHNEGMGRHPHTHMNPSGMIPFLSDIKRYTNRIVISGGEPFEYDYLDEMTALLSSYGFDLTIITANVNRTLLMSIGHRIKTIHYSIHENDKIETIEKTVLWLNDSFPNIRISLNIPFYHFEEVEEKYEEYYKLAVSVGANIQYIRIFTLNNKVNSQSWSERWDKMYSFLGDRADFLEATERETRFITRDLIKIDLLDIPCLASGSDYADGACLNNSDITIDPDFNLSICRWSDCSVPLYQDGKPVDFEKVVIRATNDSRINCRFGKIEKSFHCDLLEKYDNLPHYSWPVVKGELSNVFNNVSVNDLSYYGKSGFISLLENSFAEYIGADYALSVNSGTSAVFLACNALGLVPGNEILIPVATFPTLAAVMLSMGLRIRLCDIDSITGNITPDILANSISTDTKAVLLTHLWGLPADMDDIIRICRNRGIYIIEDCSHAYGAEYHGRKVGSFGDVACFSMQANKAVYAGEGGFFLTSNRLFYERAVTLSSSVERILDCVKNVDLLKYWGTGLGSKLKMNPIGAPLALRALRDLETVNYERSRRVLQMEKCYSNSDTFITLKKDPLIKRTYYTYKLIMSDHYINYRNHILNSLIHRGLEAGVTSFIPINKHELSSDRNVINGLEHFDGAQKYYSRIISLPAFVYEPVELAQHYGETIAIVASEIKEKCMEGLQ